MNRLFRARVRVVRRTEKWISYDVKQLFNKKLWTYSILCLFPLELLVLRPFVAVTFLVSVIGFGAFSLVGVVEDSESNDEVLFSLLVRRFGIRRGGGIKVESSSTSIEESLLGADVLDVGLRSCWFVSSVIGLTFDDVEGM